MGLKFVESDSEAIRTELVSQFESVLGETLQPSDERKIFLDQLAQLIINLKANINDTGNNVLLRYARGESLDALGELLGVDRMPAEFAKCEFEFTLSGEQEINVVIPQGTRVTPDGVIYFATDKDLTIPQGSTTGRVMATSIAAGAANNGFAVGTIKYIVDNVGFVAKVANTTASSGGTDEESDESLRERIRLVPESFSTAGCEEGYIYWTKSAHNDIGDVVVYSPEAGKVHIRFLKATGGVPDEAADAEIFSAVRAKVTAPDIRPLTDEVTVLAPDKANYSISFEWFISEEDSKNEADIVNAVNGAVDAYIKWQGEKIGRDINPDKLRQLVLNAGANRVDLTSPTRTAVSKQQVASLSGEVVKTFKGISE